MTSVTGSVIQVDEAKTRTHVEEMVCGSVEATLNGLPDTEAGRLSQAETGPVDCRLVSATAI